MRKIAITIAALVLAITLPAASQGSARIPDQLALARVAVHEAGLLVTEDEVAALGAVFRARCPRCTITTIARQYSTRVFDLGRTDPRAWAVHLRADGRRPDRWPAGMSWERHQANWMRVYDTAGRVVRGEVEHRCDGPIDHWGAPYGVDLERALRAGWERAQCGETRNAFWRIPRAPEEG